ncbi:unannotated protein [freshwater metagenome]|uniref:Unannotated protein n=1 Tax=freshwater metagenome TaxID=449393 RepID=A0A6J7DVQ2_9ZZZZ|nr:hypothetical protein [Actinomycetota bacterium]
MCQMDFSERCPSCRTHALVLFVDETFFGPDHYEGWVSQDRNGTWIFHRTPREGIRQYRASRGERARGNWFITPPTPRPNGVNLAAVCRSCGCEVTFIEPGGWRLYNNRTWAGMLMVRKPLTSKEEYFEEIDYSHEVIFSTEPMIRLVRTATNNVWWINWDDPNGDWVESQNWIPGAPYRWTEYRAGMDFVGPQPTHSFWRTPDGLAHLETHQFPSHRATYQRQPGEHHEPVRV